MPLRLRIVSEQQHHLGDARIREFAACGGTIGRTADNDWVLPDEKRYISSRHALIDFQGGAYYLVDTSRNGVYVNDADTPVGHGHPQRLFDGDWLRLGEYSIAVEITGNDADIADDGMRDSVVRAQLVPLDDADELQLVDEIGAYKTAPQAPVPKPAPAASNTARLKVGGTPAPASVAPATTASCDGTAALDIFCRAAGLAPIDLRGKTPEEALEAAGTLMRHLLTGLADLLRTRSPMKETLRQLPGLTRPGIGNLLKNSTQATEALRYLLSETGDPSQPAPRAVQAAFLDVKNHQQASIKAMTHALQDLIERFEPDELRNRFDRGLKRSALLASANKLKYWELYEDHYLTVTHQDEGAPLPRLVIDELTRAYEQEINGATRPVLPRPARTN